MIAAIFEGQDDMTDQDLIFKAIRANKEGVIGRISTPTKGLEPDSVIVTWDIVLLQG